MLRDGAIGRTWEFVGGDSTGRHGASNRRRSNSGGSVQETAGGGRRLDGGGRCGTAATSTTGVKLEAVGYCHRVQMV